MDKQDAIFKMLYAMLRSQGHAHQVGGYAWGETSNGDKFLALYPADDRLKHKVCRVYPHDFRKLPDAITANPPDTAPDDPGDKDRAQKRGIYQECPRMMVVTFDGKETQMGPEKRFSDVVWVANPDKAQRREPQPPPIRAETSPTPPAPAEDGQVDAIVARVAALYPDSPDALGAMCRRATAQKRSRPEELTPTQRAAVLVGLELREKFHALGQETYGAIWPRIQARNAERVSGGWTNQPAELTDEQVAKLIAGLERLRQERQPVTA